MLFDNSDLNEEYLHIADKSHNHSMSDMCSPFCHCNCCHVHTILLDSIKLEPLNPLAPEFYTKHFDAKNKGYHISLLQPPQFIV